MKIQYDKNAAPVQFDIGSKVWVYTPKNRKGLSKKLAHNFHGPNRITAKLSPVHFKLRTLDNRPVAVSVHVNRLKPYFDPQDRRIEPPSDLGHSPDLSDSALPDDSFSKNIPPSEPAITCPEDTFPPEEIKNYFPVANQEV